MAAHWCKVASNLDTHPKIRKAGRLGREVFLFALRRNAEPGNPVAGRIPADELEPWYVADLLQMSCDEAVTGVTAAVTAGLLVKDGASYVIVSWKDGWGKDNSNGAARTAKWRENKKVEKSDKACDARDVTQRHGDACDTDKTRLDKTRSSSPPAAQVSDGEPVKRRKGIPDDWKPRDEERAQAAELGLDCDAEAAEFFAYWLGDGRPKKNWDQTFRNRLLSQAKRKQPNLWGGAPQQPIRKIKDL